MIRRRLRVIRFASWFHISFGISILIFPFVGIVMPRPFGSMEAYLQYMPTWAMAAGFIIGGVASSAALKIGTKRLWLPVALVIPQQLILLWGMLWGIAVILNTAVMGHTFDARGWLGACQLAGLSWYHGRDLIDIWARTWSGVDGEH